MQGSSDKLDDVAAIKKPFTAFAELFRSENGLNIGLILVFGLINGLVFTNACLHDPRIGYDATENLKYIQALSHMRLVTPVDTYEFFSPPLPYVFPALLIAITGMDIFGAAKLAQFLNVFLSIGSSLFLIKACQLISPRSSLKLGALIFLGILPVYYKTFAFVRGEPFVLFFAMVILYYTLLMSVKKQFTARNSIIVGIAMGLCALSRQWGILLFPAVFLLFAFQWFRFPQLRNAITATVCICAALTVVIAGWFYLSLYTRYGTAGAFNEQSAGRFSLGNQPVKFYFGLSPGSLFSKPVRPNIPNQFMPIFYSEIWGDYWCYFTIYAKDTRTSEFVYGFTLDQIIRQGSIPDWLETNYETASSYLGRVNLVSLFPSFVILVSMASAAIEVLRRRSYVSLMTHPRVICAFLLLAIVTTMAGYFWFQIMYPNLDKGDTAKATYVLQIFPFIAILAGALLEYIKTRSQLFYRLLLCGLCLTYMHNFFAMLTHYRL
jgi:hypothetical protein